jgi:hypothetical protein
LEDAIWSPESFLRLKPSEIVQGFHVLEFQAWLATVNLGPASIRSPRRSKLSKERRAFELVKQNPCPELIDLEPSQNSIHTSPV